MRLEKTLLLKALAKRELINMSWPTGACKNCGGFYAYRFSWGYEKPYGLDEVDGVLLCKKCRSEKKKKESEKMKNYKQTEEAIENVDNYLKFIQGAIFGNAMFTITAMAFWDALLFWTFVYVHVHLLFLRYFMRKNKAQLLELKEVQLFENRINRRCLENT